MANQEHLLTTVTSLATTDLIRAIKYTGLVPESVIITLANLKTLAGRFALQGLAYQLDPADATTYYIGQFMPYSPAAFADQGLIRVPVACTLIAMYVNWYATATVGSNENITMSVDKNAGTLTTIATVGNTDRTKVFSNAGLSIAFAAGDSIMVKLVTPTWATNPTQVNINWTALFAL